MKPNHLKGVSTSLSQQELQTTVSEEVFRGRVENLRRLAAELTSGLMVLEVFTSQYDFRSVENEDDFYAQVRLFEVTLIKRAMTCTGGSQVKAARLLGLNPSTLNNKIKAYKIVL